MDFLDPKEKRNRGIRLAIGYSLMFILVVITTVVLVFQAYGFNLDRRGEVVQNGLVFFDSVPDGANIYLNGQEQGKRTNVRLSLTEGQYDIELKKDGYLPWKNRMDLSGGTVERYYYPMLLPEKLSSTRLSTYQRAPDTVLQSPDHRWVLINRPGSTSRFVRFDLNNLNADSQPASDSISFPPSLFRGGASEHRLKLIEWSDDDNNVLVRHSYRGGDDFLLLNHDDPAESVNLDVFFSRDLPSIRLRDKKADQFYIYSSKNDRLSTANLDSPQPEPFLKGVLAYNPHGDDDLLYTRLSPDKLRTMVVLRLGDDEYVIREIPAKQAVKVNLASFDGDWYPVLSVSNEKRAYVYKNPQDIIRKNDGMKPAPVMVLKLHKQPKTLDFSSNASKVMINSGSEFAVYDIEYDRPYRFNLGKNLDEGGKTVWMDGHRLMSRQDGKVLIFDFDGKNRHLLADSLPSTPAMFDRDYARLYTLGQVKNKDQDNALLQTNLRLEADMPGGLF